MSVQTRMFWRGVQGFFRFGWVPGLGGKQSVSKTPLSNALTQDLQGYVGRVQAQVKVFERAQIHVPSWRNAGNRFYKLFANIEPVGAQLRILSSVGYPSQVNLADRNLVNIREALSMFNGGTKNLVDYFVAEEARVVGDLERLGRANRPSDPRVIVQVNDEKSRLRERETELQSILSDLRAFPSICATLLEEADALKQRVAAEAGTP